MAQAESNANREGMMSPDHEDQATLTSRAVVPESQAGTGTSSNTNHTTNNFVGQSYPTDVLPSHGDNGIAAIQHEQNIQNRSNSDQAEERPVDNEDSLGGCLTASQLRSRTPTDSFLVLGHVERDDEISVITFDSKGDDGGNYNASRSSLCGIAEEGSSDFQRYHSTSQGDIIPPRTLSNGSVDPSMRTGSLAVTSEVGVEDCNTLYARKRELDTVGSVNRHDSNNSYEASAISTQFQRGGLDPCILEKQEVNSSVQQTITHLDSSSTAVDGKSVRWQEKGSLMNEKADQSMVCDEFNKSSDGNTLPGTQCADVGDSYVSLLERKKAGSGTSPTHPSPAKHGTIDQCTARVVIPDELMSESESRSLIAHCSSCSELIDALMLSSPSTETAAVLQVLLKLRGCLLDAYGLTDSAESRGRSKIAFLTSAWAKALTKVMSSHPSDSNIQSEVLQTLWVVITLHTQYVSDLMSSDNMKQVISTMQTHIKDERIQEYGCGLLSCIASDQEHALRLVGKHNGQIINRLMAALNFRGRNGKVQAGALKALFRLSLASMSSESSMELMTNAMGNCIVDDSNVGGNSSKAIMAIICVMDIHHTELSVQIEGNRLLWCILDPVSGILDTDLLCILTGRTLQHIEKAMISHRNSHVFNETAICLLSKMSCFGSDSIEPNLLFRIIRLVVDTMKAENMLTNSNSGIVSLHGCRCLFNICSSSPTLLLSEPVVDGISVVLSCMDTCQYDSAVQSEACAAISAICRNEPTNKERVHRLDGVGSIMKAFDLISTAPNEKPSVETKLRACIALTTLAVDPIVMCDIQDKGIFSKLETLIEEDPTITPELHHAIQDLLNLAIDDENMGRNLVFQERASEEGTLDCLRANLRVVTSPDFVRNRISYLRSSAVRAIERFPDSTGVQEHGCKLLACLFDLASDNESFTRFMLSPVELELSEEPDLSEELRIITLSLMNHKNIPANAAAACSALQNFCVLLALSNSDGSGDTPDLTTVLFSSLNAVINALALHRNDSDTLEHVTGAIWALCAVSEEMVPEVVNSIGLITETMNSFPGAVDLQRHCIGLLGLYFSSSESNVVFVDDDLVHAITKFIQEEINNDDLGGDGFDLIGAAISIILITVNTGFDGWKTVLRNENLIETIVGCMFRFPDSLSIQSAGIDILTNIAFDNYIRADICHKGGTSRIISALENLKHDPIVVCKALMALSNLISGADVEILRAQDASAAAIVIGAMKTHPETLYIQERATNTLWILAAKDDHFKDEIVNLGGTEVIVVAMERFIGSKHMQLRGFTIIWTLAGRGHLKKRIGRCAIEQVTNGLSAHISCKKACESALGCLICLSTTPVNKELLVENCVADLIYYCKYAHPLFSFEYKHIMESSHE